MTIITRIFGSAPPALLLLAISVGTFADTIRLKDGGIIKGKVVGFIGGSFIISVGEGSRRRELKFLASEVESIQFDRMTETASPGDSPDRNTIVNESVARPAAVPAIVKPVEPTVRPQSTTVEKLKPIELKVRVLADNTANGWTNSGWVVKKGQRIRIVAEDGTVSLGKGNNAPASGLGTLEDGQKLLKNVPTGALIAVIGEDNNDFIYIGSEREFTATRDGALFLGINESNLNDNSGAFNVKIEILPDRG
ncbi:hypothetical protein BH20ACI2_BH20ACI2_26980 [soil metagenome]